MQTPAPFVPHPLATGPHSQTILGTLLRRAPRLTTHPERFELADGDFVDLEHCGPVGGPRAILAHGIAGNAKVPYIRAIAAALHASGWSVTLFNFRGASATPNRKARIYHLGDTADLAEVAGALRARASDTPLVGIGTSLGANVLMNLLADQGDSAIFDAAIGISAPFQVEVAAERLGRGASRLYGRYILAELKRIVRRKRAQLEALVDLRATLAARDFYTFDSVFTAPLNGFASAEEYYQKVSCRPRLKDIRRPTLLIHACDDPFMTPACVPTAAELAPTITLEASPHGGHLGFYQRGPRGLPQSYLEQRVVSWLAPYRLDN